MNPDSSGRSDKLTIANKDKMNCLHTKVEFYLFNCNPASQTNCRYCYSYFTVKKDETKSEQNKIYEKNEEKKKTKRMITK